MKIEITFRDARQPISDVDHEGDSLVDMMDNNDAGYMDLSVFLEHLRAGKFGKDVRVRFVLGEESTLAGSRLGITNPNTTIKNTVEFIEYTIGSDDAPAGVYLDGLI